MVAARRGAGFHPANPAAGGHSSGPAGFSPRSTPLRRNASWPNTFRGFFAEPRDGRSMDTDFWHERWDNDQIAFHQDRVNPQLASHFGRLGAPPGARIFVPLCGKSRDMLWIGARGHPVVGVEINARAVESFFTENGITARQRSLDAFTVYEGDSYTLYLGDFFDLEPRWAGGFEYCYDRASLIALPPAMRADYARHLGRLLAPRARILLVTLEYDQREMNGPPFAVTEAEVRERYGPGFRVTRLAAEAILDQEPHFRDKGLSALSEACYLLERDAAPAA